MPAPTYTYQDGTYDSLRYSMLVPPTLPVFFGDAPYIPEYDRTWTFDLVSSDDMARIHDLTFATGKSLSLLYNGAGSASLPSIPLESEAAQLIQTVKTAILVKCNDVPIWSGPVWRTNKNYITNRLSVTAVGWLEAIERRQLRERLTYLEWLDVDIAFDLISRVNNYDPAHPLRIEYGAKMGEFQIRTRTFETFQKLGPALKEFSAQEAGYDIFIDPLTREVNFRAWDLYGDRPDAVFTVFTQAEVEEDASRFVNYKAVTGTNTSGAGGLATDEQSQNEYGLFEDMTSYSDVSDPLILQAIAEADLIMQKRGPGPVIARPPQEFKITPGSATEDVEVPRIFESWWLGDKVYFSIQQEGHEIARQAARPFAVTITPIDGGGERISNLAVHPS